MFCTHCGAEMEEGAKFCSVCGTEAAAARAPQTEVLEAPVNAQPSPVSEANAEVYQTGDSAVTYRAENAPAADPAERIAAADVLRFGIMGIAFAASFILSPVGIILSAIGLGKSRRYAASYGSCTGKAKVGHGLSIGGLALGIVLTVLLIVWIILIVWITTRVRYDFDYQDILSPFR